MKSENHLQHPFLCVLAVFQVFIFSIIAFACNAKSFVIAITFFSFSKVCLDGLIEVFFLFHSLSLKTSVTNTRLISMISDHML